MSELSTTNSQPARTVEAVTLEIQTLQRQAQQLLLGYAIEIGRRLVEVKAMLPHGQWGTYIKEQVGYSQSTANNLMRIFEEYGTAQQSIFGPEAISQAIGNLSYTKALRLLALPADEREAFVEEHNVEDMSTRELEAAIKERDDALRRAEEDRAEREPPSRPGRRSPRIWPWPTSGWPSYPGSWRSCAAVRWRWPYSTPRRRSWSRPAGRRRQMPASGWRPWRMSWQPPGSSRATC